MSANIYQFPSIPSTPDPTWTALIYAVIRHLMSILGALGVTWGSAVSGEDWQIIAGALAWFIAVGLSVWQKYQAAAGAHAGAEASAHASASATQAAGIPQVIAVQGKPAAA